MGRIVSIVGARPQFIKCAPVSKMLRKVCDEVLVHTGQHYSPKLDEIFFKELCLPRPQYNLDVGSGTDAFQTAQILLKIEKIFLAEQPDLVLVYGDTNSTLASALAASKLHLPVAHLEAGLRSFDREMPEEINRVLVDHLADYLFAPTVEAKKNLLNEGINKKKIFVSGNLIVDVLYQNLKTLDQKSKILTQLNLKRKKYFLVTAHRQENVDHPEKLASILKALLALNKKYNLPIIYPLHPRTRKRIKEFGLIIPRQLRILEPLGYFDFLNLEKNALLILTDSGGIQEESCVLKVPCVTLRENTERPETLKIKSNVLVGVSPKRILNGVSFMLQRKRNWPNPFGDGRSAQTILNIIEDLI